MKKERQQIIRIMLGNNISSLHLPKKTWLHLISELEFTLYKNKDVINPILFFLMLFCIIGCIQDNKYIEESAGQKDALSGPVFPDYIALKDNPDLDRESGQGNYIDLGNSADQDQNLHLELDFQSGVGNYLFRSWGALILWSNSSLPYLVLDATLRNKNRQVNEAKYMLMQVEPGKKYSFDISENLRMPKGEYSCILEASGPFGPITSEKRDCLALDEPADRILYNEFWAADKKASNNVLDQYRIEVTEEEGASQDQYPNDYQTPEKILGTSSADLGSELSKDAKKSHENQSADNSKLGGLESPVSIPQDASFSQFSESSVKSIERTNSESQIIAVKGKSQIADQGGNGNEIFVGSTSSDKYHRPDCRFVSKIKNKIYYKSAEDAKNSKKVPCKICNPP